MQIMVQAHPDGQATNNGRHSHAFYQRAMRKFVSLFLAIFLFGLSLQAIHAGGPTELPTPRPETTPAPVAPIPTATPAATPVATPTSTPVAIPGPEEPDAIEPGLRVPTQIEVRYFTNLRRGPGPMFDPVRTAPPGERLRVIACNEDCSWYLVGADLWVAAFVVVPVISAPDAGDPPAEAEELAPDATVNGEIVNGEIDLPVTPIEIAPIEIAPQVPSLPGQTVVTVRANTLLYRGPGTAYAVAGTLAQGTQLTVVGRNSLGNWYVVTSGDWVSRGVVTPQPANLPVAWEPPPPPDGPELVSPVAQPQIPPASGVAVPAPVNDSLYLNQLGAALINYIEGAALLTAQIRGVSENPFLLFTDAWNTRTTEGINRIRQGSQAIRSLTPTDRTRDIHNRYVSAADKLDQAMGLISQGIAELDPQKIEAGFNLVMEASFLLDQGAQLVADFQP